MYVMLFAPLALSSPWLARAPGQLELASSTSQCMNSSRRINNNNNMCIKSNLQLQRNATELIWLPAYKICLSVAFLQPLAHHQLSCALFPLERCNICAHGSCCAVAVADNLLGRFVSSINCCCCCSLRQLDNFSGRLPTSDTAPANKLDRCGRRAARVLIRQHQPMILIAMSERVKSKIEMVELLSS